MEGVYGIGEGGVRLRVAGDQRGTLGQVVTSNGPDALPTFQAAGGSASGWTDDGVVVRLTTITDDVGIGTVSPSRKVHVVSGATPAARFDVDSVGIPAGAEVVNLRQPSTGSGVAVAFIGYNSTPALVTYAGITSLIKDNTAGAEDGKISATAISSGVQRVVWEADEDPAVKNQVWYVNGVVSMTLNTTSLLVLDGTASLPGVSFLSDTNTGFYRISADIGGLSARGTECLRWGSVVVQESYCQVTARLMVGTGVITDSRSKPFQLQYAYPGVASTVADVTLNNSFTELGSGITTWRHVHVTTSALAGEFGFTITTVDGVLIAPVFTGDAGLGNVNVTTYDGFKTQPSFTESTVANYRQFHCVNPTLGTDGTITTHTAILIDALTTGTTRFAIDQVGTTDVSRFAGFVQIADGTVAAPSLTNIGDTDTGLYFPAANQVALTAGGSQIFRTGTTGASPFEPIQFTASITNAANSAITLMRADLTAIGQLGVISSAHIGFDLNVVDNSSDTMLSSNALDVNLTVNSTFGVPAIVEANVINVSFTRTAGTTTDCNLLKLRNPTGAASITTLVGLSIANLTAGGDNFSIDQLGAGPRNRLAGQLETVSGNVALANGANNNVALVGGVMQRITGPTAAYSITGIAGGENGRIITIHNTVNQTLTLTDESGSSTAANRLALNGAQTLVLDQALWLQYDATASRWRMLSIGGGVTGVATQADQETATSTTLAVTSGRQQFHPSSHKWWAFITVAAGVPTLAASYNVTSITDTAAGRVTVTIATDFSSASWSPHMACQVTGLTQTTQSYTGVAAGSIVLQNGTTVAFADPISYGGSGRGDQ